jgi:hypothetical protein
VHSSDHFPGFYILKAQVIEPSEDEDVIEEERIMAQRVGQPMDPASAIEVGGIVSTDDC